MLASGATFFLRVVVIHYGAIPPRGRFDTVVERVGHMSPPEIGWKRYTNTWFYTTTTLPVEEVVRLTEEMILAIEELDGAVNVDWSLGYQLLHNVVAN